MRYFICIFVILISFTSHAEDAERKLKVKSYHEVFTNYIAAAVGLSNIIVNHNLCESKNEHKVRFNTKYISLENYIKLYEQIIHEYGLFLDELSHEIFKETLTSKAELSKNAKNQILENRKKDKLEDLKSFNSNCWRMYNDLAEHGERFESKTKLLESFVKLKLKEDILLGKIKTEKHIKYYQLWNQATNFENSCTCLKSTKRILKGDIVDSLNEECKDLKLFIDYRGKNLLHDSIKLKILEWRKGSISARFDFLPEAFGDKYYLYDLKTNILIQTQINNSLIDKGRKTNEHIITEYQCKNNLKIL